MLHQWGDLDHEMVSTPETWKLQKYPEGRWYLPVARERRTSYVQSFGAKLEDASSRVWEHRFPRSRAWLTLNLDESFVVRSYARAYLFEFVELDVVITDRTRFRDLTSKIEELGSKNPGVNVWFAVEPFSRLDSPDFPKLLTVLRQLIRGGKLTLVVCESDLTLPDGEELSVEITIATD